MCKRAKVTRIAHSTHQTWPGSKCENIQCDRSILHASYEECDLFGGRVPFGIEQRACALGVAIPTLDLRREVQSV